MQPKARFLREAASSSSARGGLRLSSAPPPHNSQSQIVQGWGGARLEKGRGDRSQPMVSKSGGTNESPGECCDTPAPSLYIFLAVLGGGNRARHFTHTQRGAARGATAGFGDGDRALGTVARPLEEAGGCRTDAAALTRSVPQRCPPSPTPRGCGALTSEP